MIFKENAIFKSEKNAIFFNSRTKRKGTEMFTSKDYMDRMIPWLNVLPRFLRRSQTNPELMWYGTGESAHWPVQSNMNVCAALAVMAADPDFDSYHPPVSRGEVRETALSLFRYAMRTHLTGDSNASDGKPWGHHWISVLGAERMTHGVNALEPFMTPEDKERYRNFRISEADWLLNEHPVVAGIPAEFNKPESNIWNGGFLLRAALDHPDAPNAEKYREKAASFLLNGISHPSDYASEKEFRGRPMREWFVGANFTPGYSLNHHGYLNVGYMVICLSNVAMLHFNFRERGQTPPSELYHHAEDLWNSVKRFLYPDGRLLRIGGDTRARYTYCQCYAVPMFLMAAELFGDREAARFEKEWLNLLSLELDYSGDGSCYTKRLESVRNISHYYFTRLESDHILSLSYGACWRRKFAVPQPLEDSAPADAVWEDDYHDAAMIRKGNVVRSWVRAGAQGGTGLCVPLNRSSFGEWQGNLNGHIIECLPMGEGEDRYMVAELRTGAAALPDGKSMVIVQRCVVTKEVTLHGVYSLHLEIPNDIFNGFRRDCRGEKFKTILSMQDGSAGIINTHETKLNIDDAVSVFLLSGGESLKIVRSGKRNICLRKDHPPVMSSLYADIFCIDAVAETRRYLPGEVLFDIACAVSADCTFPEMEKMNGTCEAEKGNRLIRFLGADGKTYCLSVDYRSGNELPVVEMRP